MWQTRLLVLGLVGWLQPVHGYDVKRELMSWGVEDWANVKAGSIYHALKNLAQDGYLEIARTEHIENRPARTSYRMTREGERHFHLLLHGHLWDAKTSNDDFFIVWAFAPMLSHNEAAAALRHRATLCLERKRQIETLVERASNDPHSPHFQPRHVMAMHAWNLQVTQLHADWCESTARDVEAGELYGSHDAAMPHEQVAHWKNHIDKLGPDGSLPAGNRSHNNRVVDHRASDHLPATE